MQANSCSVLIFNFAFSVPRVPQTLSEQLQTGVHALSIVAKTSAEWEASNGAVSDSPACMGGGKKR